MNNRISLLITTILCSTLFASQALAQCSFTPTITISPTDADGIYCPNDIITLTTQNYDSYQWFYNFSNSNSGGTAWPGGSASSITAGASEWAVVYFYVEATDDGCTEASATVVWDAWNFLPPSISSSGQSNYCVGESTVISNAFNGPTFFQWYKDGVLISGATMSSYTVTETGTYTLSAAYPDCPNYWQSSGVGPSFVFSAPTVPQITEMNEVLTADSGVSWQWIFDGIDIPGATDASYKPDLEGMYQVRAADANGCEATSAPFQFPLPPLPIGLINFAATTNVDCEAVITWEVATESTAANYIIEHSNDGINFTAIKNIQPANRSSFTDVVPMEYAVTYVRLRMLSLEGTTSYSPVLSLENSCVDSWEKNFTVYPNPTSRTFTIENVKSLNVELSIYNSNGQLLFQQSIQDAQYSIDMINWPRGIYQLMMEGKGEKWIQRVVKL